MQTIDLFNTDGQPLLVTPLSSQVIGTILGRRNPGVYIKPGLQMVDIKLSEPLKAGYAPFLTACVASKHRSN